MEAFILWGRPLAANDSWDNWLYNHTVVVSPVVRKSGLQFVVTRTTANDGMSLEFRVDCQKSRIASGNMFARAFATREEALKYIEEEFV